MNKIFIFFLFMNILYSNYCDVVIISHCEWYNRFDLDIGVIFSCNKSNDKNDSVKIDYEIYFNDLDGVECYNKDKYKQRYYSKHMIDAIHFDGCRMYHIPYNTFKAYPYLRVLDISKLGLDSLQPEHLVGAKRSWELLAGNNEIDEIPSYLFVNAGSVTKADLSYNKIKKMNRQSFVGANELTMLDLSGNKIEVLDENAFKGLVNLTHMNLANNNIRELHPFAFVGLVKLFHLDISHNSISILEDRTFANLSKLNRLQLSYNQIFNIEKYAFATAHSLLRLDLSHNNITDEQIFDNLYNLLHLDLSHNPINELGIGTFAKLLKLEHLDLGHTNLTNIELGTFSYSRGMVTLDLSENSLKSLDFGLFLPAFRYLESLYLDGNRLSDMEGFTNSLFPRLNALGITNNNFNCSYLKHFMRSVDWEQIRLPLDRMPLNIHKTNIRGVACDLTEKINNATENTTITRTDEANDGLNNAIEKLIKNLPIEDTNNESDVKVIKLRRNNGTKAVVLLL